MGRRYELRDRVLLWLFYYVFNEFAMGSRTRHALDAMDELERRLTEEQEQLRRQRDESESD